MPRSRLKSPHHVRFNIGARKSDFALFLRDNEERLHSQIRSSVQSFVSPNKIPSLIKEIIELSMRHEYQFATENSSTRLNEVISYFKKLMRLIRTNDADALNREYLRLARRTSPFDEAITSLIEKKCLPVGRSLDTCFKSPLFLKETLAQILGELPVSQPVGTSPSPLREFCREFYKLCDQYFEEPTIGWDTSNDEAVGNLFPLLQVSLSVYPREVEDKTLVKYVLAARREFNKNR